MAAILRWTQSVLQQQNAAATGVISSRRKSRAQRQALKLAAADGGSIGAGWSGACGSTGVCSQLD